MVLNDIIEQAAGRHSRGSDHGGKENISQKLFCFIIINGTDLHNIM